MQIEVWSDVVCPFCWIGKRRFAVALDRFKQRRSVAVSLRLRAFELDPAMPPHRREGVLDYLDRKYGDARAVTQRVTEYGASDGLAFDFGRAIRVNTFDAHRLIQAAADSGVADQVAERFFRAHFTEGDDLADHDRLTALAAEAGLDRDEAARVLASQDYADEVRADQAEARALGATGVPFFVIDRRLGVPGAQPIEVFLDVLEQAYAEAQQPA